MLLVRLALSTGFRDSGCMHVCSDMPSAYDGMRSMLRSQRHPYQQRLARGTTWPSLLAEYETGAWLTFHEL